jgi:TRAP-type C4-dicarboxylate transport system permease small subunit
MTNTPALSHSNRRIGLIERIEESVTIGFFLITFTVVLLGVVSRYVFNDPIVWTIGVATASYIWVLSVGAGLSNRDDDHIQFDLIYDYFSTNGKLWARILGNLLIIVPFALAIPGTLTFLEFVAPDRIGGTSISYFWAYAAMLVLLIATILHRGRLLSTDLKTVISQTLRRAA